MGASGVLTVPSRSRETVSPATGSTQFGAINQICRPNFEKENKKILTTSLRQLSQPSHISQAPVSLEDTCNGEGTEYNQAQNEHP